MNLVKENSTEKLLDTIRNADPHTPVNRISTDFQETARPIQLKKMKKRNLQIGVFLSEKDISFVLTAEKGSNRQKCLIKWAVTKIPDNLTIGDDEFILFLSLNLKEFSENLKGLSIWCALDSSYVKFRNIEIPDLPLKKIPNAALWGLKKEIEFDISQEIFDFRVTGDHLSEGRKRKKIFALTANKTEVKNIRSLFSKAGYPLEGITSIPFAFQNYIHASHIDIKNAPFGIIHFSDKASELFCFSGPNLLLARKIRSDLYGLIAEKAKTASLNTEQYLSSQTDLSADDLFEFEQSFARLSTKIIRTGEYCSQNYASNQPIERYLLFGATFKNKIFSDSIQQVSPVEIIKFDPAFNDLPKVLNIDLPKDRQTQNKIMLAFGIALSSNEYTVNFIHTQTDRLKKKKEKKINTITAAVCSLAVLACISVSSWQQGIHKKEMEVLDNLVKKKQAVHSGITYENIMGLIKDTTKKLNQKNRYSSTYYPIGIVNEIFSLTPENISFSSFESNFGHMTGSQKEKQKPGTETVLANIVISGSIPNNQTNLEFDLAQYILKLENSRFLKNIQVLQKNIRKDKAILNFKLALDVL